MTTDKRLSHLRKPDRRCKHLQHDDSPMSSPAVHAYLAGTKVAVKPTELETRNSLIRDLEGFRCVRQELLLRIRSPNWEAAQRPS